MVPDDARTGHGLGCYQPTRTFELVVHGYDLAAPVQAAALGE